MSFKSFLIHEEQRNLSHLVTSPPRIFNDANIIISSSRPKTKEPIPTLQDYKPPPYVADMHDAPRFGHTNLIGLLASSNPEDASDYSNGLHQFTLFVIVPFLIWGIVLIVLKFLYGIPRVGCAAGGEVIDLQRLSKQGVSRQNRKKRIRRSWRLQTTFILTAASFIPAVSWMMMNEGWAKVQLAWDEVDSVLDDVETLAYRGWNVVEELQTAKTNLYDNDLVISVVLKQKQNQQNLFTAWCPHAAAAGGAERLAIFEQAMTTIESNTETLLSLFDDYVPETANGFIAITHATESVAASIQWFFSHDWIWKLYIMALSVLSFFMVLCCFVFSKHNIIHLPTRYYLTFLIVPLFSIFTILLILVTASAGVATLMNADFCAGDGNGAGYESPQGTIRDAIFSYQHGTLHPTSNHQQPQNLTGTLGLVYDAFNYYANGCLTENPLSFLDDYANRVEQSAIYVADLADRLPDTPETVAMLNQECGSDVSFLPKALGELKKELLVVQSNINVIVDMSQCYSISPLLRRLTYGSICSGSAEGLTWIWACSLVICICCFVLLTTRAALYNPVLIRKKRDKKPKRVVEKEFEEYKQFMGDYYEDAAHWKLECYDSDTEKTRKNTMMLMLDSTDSEESQPGYLDTAITTKIPLSTDEEVDPIDDGFHGLDISQIGDRSLLTTDEVFVNDDNKSIQTGQEAKPTIVVHTTLQKDADLDSRDSNSDSDYESDSDDSESGEDHEEESAMLSFFIETKSIFSESISVLSGAKSIASSVARQAVQRIRNLRPLLGKATDEDEDDDYLLERDGIPFEDNSLFLQSPPRNGRTGEGLWKYFTPPPPTMIPSSGTVGRSRRMGIKTPMAPQKPFNFLGRISKGEENELVPLTTMTPTNDENEIPSETPGVYHPRRLKLSPFMVSTNITCSPTEVKPEAAKPKRSKRQSSSYHKRSDFDGVSKSELPASTLRTNQPTNHFSHRPQRLRLGSEDSDDISLYVEDSAAAAAVAAAPKAPTKPIRRLARFSLERGGNGSGGDGTHR